jgi:hypothetical protein
VAIDEAAQYFTWNYKGGKSNFSNSIGLSYVMLLPGRSATVQHIPTTTIGFISLYYI